jgi:hypothetical protein
VGEHALAFGAEVPVQVDGVGKILAFNNKHRNYTRGVNRVFLYCRSCFIVG